MSDTTAMTAQLDPDFDRYRLAVRRYRLPILGAAIVCGALAMFILGTTGYQVATQFDVFVDAEGLAAVDLDESLSDTTLINRSVQFFADDTLQTEVTNGNEQVEITSQIDPATSSVVVTVTSPTEAESRAVSAVLFERFDEFVSERRIEAVDSVADILGRQQSEIRERTAELDGSLSALADGDVLRDAYLYERERLVGDDLYLSSQLRAIERFAGSTRRIDVVSSSDDDVDSRLTWLITGTILGALLAGAAVLLLAHFDTRVRLRSEVRAASGGADVVVVPDPNAPGHGTGVAAAQAVFGRMGGPVTLVPVGGHRATAVAETLAGAGVTVTDAHSLSPATGDAASAVVVTCSGASRAADVMQTHLTLNALGYRTPTAVLGGVPKRELARAVN